MDGKTDGKSDVVDAIDEKRPMDIVDMLTVKPVFRFRPRAPIGICVNRRFEIFRGTLRTNFSRSMFRSMMTLELKRIFKSFAHFTVDRKTIFERKLECVYIIIFNNCLISDVVNFSNYLFDLVGDPDHREFEVFFGDIL